MITDAAFGFEADMQNKHQSIFNDSYYYVYGYRSSNAFWVPEWMGMKILLFINLNMLVTKQYRPNAVMKPNEDFIQTIQLPM